jgi:hypothetical protein
MPQKCAKNPPKIAQSKTVAVVGVMTMLYCDIIPRLPPGDPRGEKSLGIVYRQKKKSEFGLSRPVSGQKTLNCQRKVCFHILQLSSASSKKKQSGCGKISDLKYQTLATDSSYVGQVRVRVRVKVRVNTKKWKISTC